MKYIEVFEDFSKEYKPYEEWELGLIKAWGHVLYLGYHDLPENIEKKVDINLFKETFVEYLYNSDNDDDLQDWMSDEPPTMNKGFALFDKKRISDSFYCISRKVILDEPLIVFRTSEHQDDGWNSYSTSDTGYEGWKDNSVLRSYLLPVGTPIINANQIADSNEIILNLNKTQLKNYLI